MFNFEPRIDTISLVVIETAPMERDNMQTKVNNIDSNSIPMEFFLFKTVLKRLEYFFNSQKSVNLLQIL